MTGAAQRACYESIQQDAYERALQLYLLQDTAVQYVRAEVRGYGQTTRYHRYPYLYPVSKGVMPGIGSWNPGQVQDVSFFAGGSMVKLTFPVTSFSVETDILIERNSDVRGKRTEGFFVTEDAFFMTAFDNTGKQLPPSAWGTALPVTVGAQTPSNVAELGDSLLLKWTGDAWEDGSCGEYVYLDGGAFSTSICAPGLYAVGEKTALVYMPVGLGK